MFTLKQRKYFDLCATVCRPNFPSYKQPYDPAVMLSDMEYAGIHKIAAIHNGAIGYSFEMGNREIIDLSKTNNRIAPLAVVCTTAPLETGNPNYFDDLIAQGVCGFFVPDSGAIAPSLEPKSMEKMAETLIKHKRPLLIQGVGNDVRYQKVNALAHAYPELAIVMLGTSWGGMFRTFWDVMSQNDNLYFDFLNNQNNHILEMTKEHFGIERVLYNSSWPLKSMGALKCMIEYADISDADKDLVAHGNACRLFGISEDSLVLYDNREEKLDQISMEADQGIAISVPVIDSHTHMVNKGDAVNNTVMMYSDHNEMAKKMERLGIDVTMTAPWSGINYNGIWGNKESLDAINNHPGKYLAYSCANINYPGEIDAAIQMHKDYPDLFVGIKPYPPYQNFALTADVCKPWFEYANEHHLLALIHSDGGTLSAQVDTLADIYPNITFILAHSGISYGVAHKNAEIANKHDNVVLEITYTSTLRGMIELLVSLVGADKVLFGSDTPMRDASPQLGWVCYADIPFEDKKKILAENVQRLLKKRI